MAQITTHYKGEMLFESKMGNHTLTIDVPASMGGTDRGPTPPELFIASLGSCIAAFVADYAKRANLDATDMSVDLSFEKAEDPLRLVNLKATVRMPNAACGPRESAIRRVAEHCPVHQTISTLEGIEIEIIGKQC